MKKLLFLCILALFATTSTAQSDLPSIDSLQTGWNAIPTDGVCSTGTPYQFFARNTGQSNDLLVFFNGGGACWFGQACDLNSEPNMHFPFAQMPQNDPGNALGIFDFGNTENPFADFDMVFIPYCTGDVHIGGGEKKYSYTNSENEEASVTTYHSGYSNSQQVLNWIYDNFDSPSRIVVAGSSAGAIGSSFYSGFIAEHYNEAAVVLLADAAGAYGSPYLPVTHSAWNTEAILPSWPEYAGETNATITFEDFYIASANHNPNLTLAQVNTAYDQTQISFTLAIGDAPGSFSLPQRLLNNYLVIESGVDTFYSYTAGGRVHTILGSDIFYDYTVEGIRFVDWVGDLIDGNAVVDVSCVREAAGCENAPGSD